MTARHIVAVSWSSGQTMTHDCEQDEAKAQLLVEQARVLSRSTPATAAALGLPGVPTRVLTLTEYGDQ